MTKKETKNIYQRLSAVMAEVKGVNKEVKKVNGQYTFVSHDAVARLLHEPLVRHGILFVPSVEKFQQVGSRTEATVRCEFINIDNPDDRIEVYGFGYGIDNQDKGPGKAVSYAVKYVLLKTFCLETGDDVEKDNTNHSENDPHDPFISEVEVAYLEDVFKEDTDALNKLMKHFKVKEIAALKMAKWNDVLNLCSRYIKTLKEKKDESKGSSD